MWELIWLMVIMKIPILYLCWVVYWAIKSEPRPDQPAALVTDSDDSDPTPVAARTAIRGGPARTADRLTRIRPHALALRFAHELDAVQRSAGRPRRSAGFLAAASIFVSLAGVAYRPLAADPVRDPARADRGRNRGRSERLAT